MNCLIIDEITLLEYKIKKLHTLKKELELSLIKTKKTKETINSIDNKINEYDKLLLSKYIELEQTKK